MIFTKMHGLGNDYVCINCFRERVEDPSGFARTLCDRHYGIGADGLILICPSKVSDFKMEIQFGWLCCRDVRQWHPMPGKICI